MSGPDSIANIQREEIRRLRRFSPTAILVPAFVALILITFCFLGYLCLTTPASTLQTVELKREQLAARDEAYIQRLAKNQSSYQSWLKRKGTQAELRAFIGLSLIAFNSIAGDDTQADAAGALMTRLTDSLLRVCFILISCWRLWLIAIGGAALWAYYRLRPYSGATFLGQTGNGQLYYSGIRSALENVSHDGAPGNQVIGLACPRSVATADINSSELGQLLKEHEIDNPTNVALAGILLAYNDWPAYVAMPEDTTALENSFHGATLPEATTIILKAALTLRVYFEEDVEQVPRTLDDLSRELAPDQLLDLDEYSVKLGMALHRVLTPRMRTAIAQAPLDLVATTVLGYQAGKVMAYAHEGERWIRKSNFSQLAARAILHSVASYSETYSYEDRRSIRQALIYGSRSSVFGPVRFASDMSSTSRALRQWVEVLMACPHELDAVADEVELFGLCSEIHENWERIFYDRISELAQADSTQIYSTDTRLLLMHLEVLVKILRTCTTTAALARLKEMITLVSQRQQHKIDAAKLQGEEESPGSGVPGYERILPPLSTAAIARIAGSHDLSEESVADWSALRIVLNQFGWLAHRVGDYTVPESSVIFAVLSDVRSNQPLNHLGLLGKPGMVPFRATRCIARWGADWVQLFTPAGAANMAETGEQFERLMNGVIDEIEEEVLDNSNAGSPPRGTG